VFVCVCVCEWCESEIGGGGVGRRKSGVELERRRTDRISVCVYVCACVGWGGKVAGRIRKEKTKKRFQEES
jgi:hypothetical protein